MASMYTMALVQRRDISSLRDLKKKHVPWLKALQKQIVEGICQKYPEIEEDQIKLYIHCIIPIIILPNLHKSPTSNAH